MSIKRNIICPYCGDENNTVEIDPMGDSYLLIGCENLNCEGFFMLTWKMNIKFETKKIEGEGRKEQAISHHIVHPEP